MQLPTSEPVRLPALSDAAIPVQVFETRTVIMRITAALDAVVAGSAADYAQWTYRIRRVDGTMVELHEPGQYRNTSAGIQTGQRVVTWDATNAPNPNNQLLYANAGDVLLVSKTEVGAGADIPSGSYIVSGLNVW